MKAQKNATAVAARAVASQAAAEKGAKQARQRTLFQVYRDVAIIPVTRRLNVNTILCADVRSCRVSCPLAHHIQKIMHCSAAYLMRLFTSVSLAQKNCALAKEGSECRCAKLRDVEGLSEKFSYRQLVLFETAGARFEAVGSGNAPMEEREAVMLQECSILGCTPADIDAYNHRPGKVTGQGTSIEQRAEVRLEAVSPGCAVVHALLKASTRPPVPGMHKTASRVCASHHPASEATRCRRRSLVQNQRISVSGNGVVEVQRRVIARDGEPLAVCECHCHFPFLTAVHPSRHGLCRF